MNEAERVEEVVDAIEAWSLNFHRGNAVTCIARAALKDPAHELEQLEVAAWHLGREIARLKSEASGVRRRRRRTSATRPEADDTVIADGFHATTVEEVMR